MASGLEWTILRPTGIAQNFSEGFLLPGILEADTVVTRPVTVRSPSSMPTTSRPWPPPR